MLNVVENGMSLPQTDMKKKLGTEVTSLADLVTTRIRDLIITGEFKSGQQLKEEELCEAFGISRPPIREAFKTLEANNLVKRRPRRGVIVAEYTTKDVEEVYTIIAMVYQKATDMAIKVITDSYQDLLESHIETMEKSVNVDPPDLRQYQEAHTAFHEIIMELAGNERMKVMEKQLRYQISIFSYKSLQDRNHLLSSLDYHRRILQAIRKKDREEALVLVEEHITTATEVLVQMLSD